jgi:hypothetical protein
LSSDDEIGQLGVTPLVGKCGLEGDLGLSGVEMEDEERGELGEREYGIGVWGLSGKRSPGEMWLRKRLWGRGAWAVRDKLG